VGLNFGDYWVDGAWDLQGLREDVVAQREELGRLEALRANGSPPPEGLPKPRPEPCPLVEAPLPGASAASASRRKDIGSRSGSEMSISGDEAENSDLTSVASMTPEIAGGQCCACED